MTHSEHIKAASATLLEWINDIQRDLGRSPEAVGLTTGEDLGLDLVATISNVREWIDKEQAKLAGKLTSRRVQNKRRERAIGRGRMITNELEHGALPVEIVTGYHERRAITSDDLLVLEELAHTPDAAELLPFEIMIFRASTGRITGCYSREIDSDTWRLTTAFELEQIGRVVQIWRGVRARGYDHAIYDVDTMITHKLANSPAGIAAAVEFEIAPSLEGIASAIDQFAGFADTMCGELQDISRAEANTAELETESGHHMARPLVSSCSVDWIAQQMIARGRLAGYAVEDSQAYRVASNIFVMLESQQRRQIDRMVAQAKRGDSWRGGEVRTILAMLGDKLKVAQDFLELEATEYQTGDNAPLVKHVTDIANFAGMIADLIERQEVNQ